MNKILYCFALFISIVNINCQTVTIPDPAFKMALINHIPVIDTNADGEIQYSEAEAVTGVIDVSGTSGSPGSISDITGIEAFISMDEFRCSYNQITTIDLSDNSLLRHLVCNENPVSSANLSNNSILRTLSFSSHSLSSLDVSQNNDLLLLQCNFGPLSNLTLGNQPELQFLYIQDNQLSEVNLNGAPSLVAFICEYNKLSSLDFSNNPLLDYLLCRNNNLIYLDLSNNPNLRTLHCKSNLGLSYINLQNGANGNLNISGLPPNTSNFEDLPTLETVCVDKIGSPLTDFITTQTGQSVNYIEECILGFAEKDQNSILVYPVPATNQLFINSETPILRIEVYNPFGNLMLTKTTNDKDHRIDIAALKPGIYILVLKDRFGSQKIRKIIKR